MIRESMNNKAGAVFFHRRITTKQCKFHFIFKLGDLAFHKLRVKHLKLQIG